MKEPVCPECQSTWGAMNGVRCINCGEPLDIQPCKAYIEIMKNHAASQRVL